MLASLFSPPFVGWGLVLDGLSVSPRPRLARSRNFSFVERMLYSRPEVYIDSQDLLCWGVSANQVHIKILPLRRQSVESGLEVRARRRDFDTVKQEWKPLNEVC